MRVPPKVTIEEIRNALTTGSYETVRDAILSLSTETSPCYFWGWAYASDNHVVSNSKTYVCCERCPSRKVCNKDITLWGEASCLPLQDEEFKKLCLLDEL